MAFLAAFLAGIAFFAPYFMPLPIFLPCIIMSP
jgi:hypothetical protein